MSAAECVWCEQPATTLAPYRRKLKVPACELHAAIAKRKNHYMPCVISADFDTMTPAEQAAAFRATWWADLITGAEWPVVLGKNGVKAYVRSRLKKKAVGWIMALSRIVLLNPEFGAQVLREADALYRDQIRGTPPVPWSLLADLLEQGWEQDGLGAWLQPLRNLSSYSPGGLSDIAARLADDEQFATWRPNDPEAEAAGP